MILHQALHPLYLQLAEQRHQMGEMEQRLQEFLLQPLRPDPEVMELLQEILQSLQPSADQLVRQSLGLLTPPR